MAVYRDYVLRVPPEEVLQKLQTTIGQDSLLGFSDAPEEAVIGMTGDRSFRLRIKHGWNNAFAPMIYGTVRECEGGSRVTIRLSYHRMVTGMLVVWYAIVLLIPLVHAFGIESTVFRWKGGGDPWKNSLIGAGVIFGASQVFGLLNYGDRSILLGFAERVFGPGATNDR